MKKEIYFIGGIIILSIAILFVKQQMIRPGANTIKESALEERTTNERVDNEEAVLEGLDANNDNSKDNELVDDIWEGEHDMESMDELLSYPAGTVLNTKDIGREELNHLFYINDITDEIKHRIDGKSYGKSCDIPYSDLRYLRVLHWGFDGQTHIGEIIVNKIIAEDTIEIFQELYDMKYPIERMLLIDEYNADDNASMADNNTSAFNYRNIDSSKRLSLHSYGLAIDINPLYNPYVREIDGKTVVLPVEGEQYADRTQAFSYYIQSGDICYKSFTDRGFTWGGDWTGRKDYQHFQMPLEH